MYPHPYKQTTLIDASNNNNNANDDDDDDNDDDNILQTDKAKSLEIQERIAQAEHKQSVALVEVERVKELYGDTTVMRICMRLSIGKHKEMKVKELVINLHRSVISPEEQRRRVTRANQNRGRNVPRKN